ncbi:hypothetical protein O6H91_07G081200 [Diphasiastrum complanatum]|uniref:Uncharacterized protein n=2 Tax=Diphasiastrum complanatum TaxID=34168 RepID=A0ACC2D6X7_DIPCM|nr:hypothetical protein O6H91_07G081000 [Diphasiastrum complanatum]KAJ7550064.1 hypothetical protein O6H91_07G081200 [Diphasiastrum complanatum]
MTTSTEGPRVRPGPSMITAEELLGGLLQHVVAETHPTSPSRRMLRTLLQSDSDINSTGSRFNIQILIILAILLCLMICFVALHTLVRRMIDYRRCGDDDCSDNGVVQVESLGSEKNDTECMSVVSYSNYKSPLQSLDESSECAICLGEFGRGEEQRVLPNCKHSFHSQCIAMWLCSHTSCPTCRDEILTRPETPASSWSRTSFSGDEGMLRSEIVAFRRSPRLVSSPPFRSASLFTMLSEDGGRAPTMLFAEALSPSPYDYYANR